MEHRPLRTRRLKENIRRLLLEEDLDRGFSEIVRYPGRRIVNPLFSFLYAGNELLKWRAVSAMGVVVDNLARENMESARIVMRRLMWNLNDESGGIGWGSPEAMGEIMAQNENLAVEYHSILISFMAEDQNYLEHHVLQRGFLWGAGRLAHAKPALLGAAAPHLNPFFKSTDPLKRALSAWAALPLRNPVNLSGLKNLLKDEHAVRIYVNGVFETLRIDDLAVRAITAIENRHTGSTSVK
ncbi:MAG: hypothetical protein R6U50_16270 [Desulfobacterales bacterium]